MMIHRTLIPPLLAALAALAAAESTAYAAPDFPRTIASTLSLDYQPPCSICHQNGKTGDGTPIELFAWSMRARGLTGDHSSLVPALAADETDEVDSDGDGISDIDELKNGTDVNSPANDCIIPTGTVIHSGQCTPAVQASPNLGCSATEGDSSPAPTQAWLVAMGLVGLAVAVRRRRPTVHRNGV